MIKTFRGVLGLAVFTVFALTALAIFLYPVYTAFIKQDSLQMVGLLVSWLPAYLVGYIGVSIGSAIMG